MTAKTKTFLIAGVMVAILGFATVMISIATPNITYLIIFITLGMVLIIAGVLVSARYYIQFIKERRGFMMEGRPVNAAMGWQAQAEYNRRLAAYSKEGAPADELTQAKLFAQAVITLKLMTPYTAVFSDLNETAVAENNGAYTVTGWVDAQNLYGAMMRRPFSMVVFKKDGVWQTGR